MMPVTKAETANSTCYGSVVLGLVDLPSWRIKDLTRGVPQLVQYFKQLLIAQDPVGQKCLIMPSVSELSRFFDVDPSFVLAALRKLKEQGYYTMPGGLYGEVTLWGKPLKSLAQGKQREWGEFSNPSQKVS